MSQQRSVGLVMEGAVITHKYLGAGEALFASISAHSLAGRSGPRVLSARRERLRGGAGWAGAPAVQHYRVPIATMLS